MITPTPRRLPGYGGMPSGPGGPAGPGGPPGKGGMPPSQLGPGSGTEMMPDPVPPDPMQQMMQQSQGQMPGMPPRTQPGQGLAEPGAPMNPQNVDPYLGLQRRRLGGL